MSFFAPDPPVIYRPLSVSIIGWYHAVSGFLGLFFSWIPLMMPSSQQAYGAMGVDSSALLAVGFASNLVYAVAGTAILKRKDWGRILLLVALPSVMVASSFFAPGFRILSLFSGVATLAVLAYFLTRPAANDYFSGAVLEAPDSVRDLRRHQRAEGSGSELKRVFAVIAAVPGWYLSIIATVFAAAGVYRSAADLGEVSSGIFLGVMGTLFAMLLVIGVGLLIIGTFLWGAKRWKAYIGWGLLAVGVVLVWTSLLGLLPMDVERFLPPELAEDFDPEQFAAIIRVAARYGLAGGAAALLGAWGLLKAQREHDMAAIEEIDFDDV